MILHRLPKTLPRHCRRLAGLNGYRSTSCNVQRRTFADVAADDSTLPLQGYKVLDMTRVLAGVYMNQLKNKKLCTDISHSHTARKFSAISGTILSRPHLHDQILTKSSAEVIKVEHPTRGDDTRAWGPPYAKYLPGSGKEGQGESAYFFAVRTINTQACHMQNSILDVHKCCKCKTGSLEGFEKRRKVADWRDSLRRHGSRLELRRRLS